jgi:hypothetical protein
MNLKVTYSLLQCILVFLGWAIWQFIIPESLPDQIRYLKTLLQKWPYSEAAICLF